MQKEVITYTRKENDINRKSTFQIPEEYWTDFEYYENVNQEFYALLKNHYDDLKFYALMFRDVDLVKPRVDFSDKSFFVQRKNLIIGYKEYVQNKHSLKSLIAQLYFAYEPMFIAFCRDYLKLELRKFIYTPLQYSRFVQIKAGNLGEKFSINDLTKEQCEIILQNKSKIKEWIVCNEWIFPLAKTKREFLESFYIPCFFLSQSKWDFRRKYIISYLLEKFPNEDVCKIVDNVKEETRIINQEERDLYAVEHLKLKKFKYGSTEYNESWSKIIERSSQILESCLFKSSEVWQYLYNNQSDINRYLNKIYDSYFKKFWSKDLRFRNQSIIARNNYYEFIENYLSSKELKNEVQISSAPFSYNDREQKLLVRQWEKIISLHIKELEEKEKIEREQKAELERIEYEKRMEKYRFNKRNAHVRDKNIELRQSDHIYIVNGIALDSVTTFVNNAFPKFDAEYHAKRKAEQLRISIKEVLDMWEQKGKESRDLGTTMHNKIENYYLGNDSSETDAYKLFKTFANKIELKPYRTEWAVYDWEHKIAGTIDFVDYQNGEYIIYDWKRSDKIIENGMPVKINKYGEKGNHPLEHLDNTPYYHYALQLSLYKYILEKNYGMKISDLRLGIFHPSYNKPYVLRMPYLEKEINDIFSLRSEVIF